MANVADGLFDSSVIIDFIEEISEKVRPITLVWDKNNGGLLLDYEVVSEVPLESESTIDLHWATGTSTADLIGAAFASITVPEGTNPGSYDGVNIQINQRAPSGVTHIVAVAGTESLALSDVRVTGGVNADLSKVTSDMMDLIKDGLRKAGSNTCQISSTARTAEDQARAMFQNLVNPSRTVLVAENIQVQLGIYAPPGDAVILAFQAAVAGLTREQIIASSAAIQATMVNEINNQGPSNVSRHCADPGTLCVVDVGAALLPGGQGQRFIDFIAPTIKSLPNGDYLDERSTNSCFHLEL